MPSWYIIKTLWLFANILSISTADNDVALVEVLIKNTNAYEYSRRHRAAETFEGVKIC